MLRSEPSDTFTSLANLWHTTHQQDGDRLPSLEFMQIKEVAELSALSIFFKVADRLSKCVVVSAGERVAEYYGMDVSGKYFWDVMGATLNILRAPYVMLITKHRPLYLIGPYDRGGRSVPVMERLVMPLENDFALAILQERTGDGVGNLSSHIPFSCRIL